MIDDDYYDEPGCCMTCSDARTGCLCYECNCRKCGWLEAGKCTYRSEEYEEDHEYLPLDMIRIVHSTEKAFLFKFPDNREVWIPKSVCDEEYRVQSWFIDSEDLLSYVKEEPLDEQLSLDAFV